MTTTHEWKNDVRLTRIESLRIRDAQGVARIVRFTNARIQVLRDAAGWDVETLIPQILYGAVADLGDGPDIREAEIVFGGYTQVAVRRDLVSNEVLVTVDGEDADLDGDSPGRHLFGLDREEFERVFRYDARLDAHHGGEDELARALRGDLDGLLPKAPAVAVQDLEVLASRRKEIEEQLRAMPPILADDVDELDDPEALGELLEALGEARTVELRMLQRRQALAESLETARRNTRNGKVKPTESLMEELERTATQLEDVDGSLEEIRQEQEAGGGYAFKVVVAIFLVAAALLAVLGKQLQDSALLRLGLGIAVASVVLIVFGWFMRVNRIMSAARTARALRSQRLKHHDRARQLCARLGASTLPDDVTAQTLRVAIDRTRKRGDDQGTVETLAPFIDGPDEIRMVKTLAQALERPLNEAARESRQTPPVPIVRVTQAALRLASEWQGVVRLNTERARAACEASIRRKVDRELLESSLSRVVEAEREARKSRPLGEDPARRAYRERARQLDRQLLPLLTRSLGRLAPRKFRDDLSVEFVVEPTGAVNTLVVMLSRLLVPADGRRVLSIGRILVDPGMGLDDATLPTLAQILANHPATGVAILTTHRESQLGDLATSGGPSWLAASSEVRPSSRLDPAAGELTARKAQPVAQD
ncbi:MAG: hypothetical protein KDB53_04730 [Planctomycetes bacterium]|nr:hypothetical protein [Planctomycetota bacterium]